MLNYSVLVVSAAVCLSPLSARAQSSDSLQAFAWLIGTWTYRDAAVDPADTFHETGTRTCAFALRNRSIRCISLCRTRTRERVYEFHFGWNAIDQRFEMLAMHSDYGRTLLCEVRRSPHGDRLELIGHRWGQGATSSQAWATIQQTSDSSMTWTTRVNRGADPPDRWTIRALDQAIRRRP